MKHPKYAHSFEVFYELPEPLRELKRLAYNFRWTWHHETQELFREMDRTLWSEVEHNPVQLLNRIPRERLERLARDQMFLNDLGYAVEDLDRYLAEETWFDREYPGEREKTLIAYFCAEFGISEALPIYSGGLGVLAGDHLKAASDLGLPLVGVGLLYSRGYFRQVMTPDGWQQEVYPDLDPASLPMHHVTDAQGRPVEVSIPFDGRECWAQAWRVDVGNVPLYVLTTNIERNPPGDREITARLYGGDNEMR
ncbi:MAG: alpha-glucan family phosphorylase, partial [Fimbriimonadaceae bacterium]